MLRWNACSFQSISDIALSLYWPASNALESRLISVHVFVATWFSCHAGTGVSANHQNCIGQAPTAALVQIISIINVKLPRNVDVSALLLQ